MTKKLTTSVILIIFLILGSTAARSQCVQTLQSVGIAWPGANYNTATLQFGLGADPYRSQIMTGAIQWNSCNEDSMFPWFVESTGGDPGNNINVQVNIIAGTSPPRPNTNSTPCASYRPSTYTMSIYTQHRDEYGDVWDCPLDNPDVLSDIVAHELGHFLGLANSDPSCGSFVYIMNAGPRSSGNQGTPPSWNSLAQVTGEEKTTADNLSRTPQEDPECPEGDQNCGEQGGGQGNSPILFDMDQNNFHLAGADEAVLFDIDGNGIKEAIAWTRDDQLDAFLYYDRNGNNIVDSGGELFGNWTRLANGFLPANGYIALAEFDQPHLGGNDNGLLDPGDDAFSELGLWFDLSHDGVSDADELLSLSEAGVEVIDLVYDESRRRDQYGNEFRYFSEAQVWVRGKLRWVKTTDVFFATRE